VLVRHVCEVNLGENKAPMMSMDCVPRRNRRLVMNGWYWIENEKMMRTQEAKMRKMRIMTTDVKLNVMMGGKGEYVCVRRALKSRLDG
jgi:hypothetical protein